MYSGTLYIAYSTGTATTEQVEPTILLDYVGTLYIAYSTGTATTELVKPTISLDYVQCTLLTVQV